tara:strand:+ start:186 stop:371 length:186 start_codon:yes stop_codon:yes gene_type:complete
MQDSSEFEQPARKIQKISREGSAFSCNYNFITPTRRATEISIISNEASRASQMLKHSDDGS